MSMHEHVQFATDTADASGPGASFPLATQRLRLGDAALPAPAGKPGWAYLNLNTSYVDDSGMEPVLVLEARQAYVEPIQFSESGVQGGGAAAALPLDSGNDPRPSLVLPPPPPPSPKQR